MPNPDIYIPLPMLPNPEDELVAIDTLSARGDPAGARARANQLASRLAAAVIERPDEPGLRAYLALALHAAGRSSLALGTMLEVALAAAPDAVFGAYARGLAERRARLLTATMIEERVTGD